MFGKRITRWAAAIAAALFLVLGALVLAPPGGSRADGSIFAWEWQNPLPQGNHLRGVSALDQDRAWAVGDGGIILFWNGTFWSPQASGTTNHLRGVSAFGQNRAWAVGDSGTILFWNGSSWSPQASGTTNHLSGFNALDQDRAWAVGSGGTILFGTKQVAHTVAAQVASGQGTVNPATQQVAHGDDADPITITPDAGWHIASITDNGAPVTVTNPSGMTYTVENVTQEHIVRVIFQPNAQPDTTWYLAEGCTGGDFETWVLVQNPGTSPVSVDLTFMTSSGPQSGPQDFSIGAGSRHSFRVNDYVTDWDVSTKVEASGEVICERAMYGGGRTWAHDSIGYSP